MWIKQELLVPTTWGEAILVPVKLLNPPPGTVERMLVPGAQSSTLGPLELLGLKTLVSVMFETAITDLYLAG